MGRIHKDTEYIRIVREEWDKVRLPIKKYLDKTGKSIKFTCAEVKIDENNTLTDNYTCEDSLVYLIY